MLKAGDTLRQLYQIERTVGEGGMGGVYLASYLGSGGGLVAIKEMQMHLFSSPKVRDAAIRQFQTEAGMLYTLRHRALPRMYDFFKVDDRWFLVMDYIAGITLRQRLEQKGPVDEAYARRMVRELADVLGYMHSHKPPVIFRDLKPSNVMEDEDGHLKLIDFGIAKLLSESTQTTTLIRGAGTRGFASLEQYSGGTDARSDIYSLGATCYCLLTGQVPPAAPSLAMGGAVLTPLQELNPRLSPALSDLVTDMLQITPGGRPSISEILQRVAALPPLEPVEDMTISQAAPEAEPVTAPLPPPVSWTLLLVGESGSTDAWQKVAVKYHRRFQGVRTQEEALAYLEDHPTTAVIVKGLPSQSLAERCNELHVPFFVVSDSNSTLLRLEMTALGCAIYFVAPVGVTVVMEAVEAVIRAFYRPAPVILIVDDDPLALTAVEGTFLEQGMEVHCLQEPLQFWETVERVKPDFVILDLEMPGTSGLHLCRSVRTDIRWRSLPVLILTSSNDADTIDAAYAAGADDYASKPIFVSDLATRIHNRLLRQAKLKSPRPPVSDRPVATHWRKLSSHT